MNGVLQIQVCGDNGEVIGIMIEIVAGCGLGRSPVAAAVVRNDAKTSV
jgi:hypothetical protein